MEGKLVLRGTGGHLLAVGLPDGAYSLLGDEVDEKTFTGRLRDFQAVPTECELPFDHQTGKPLHFFHSFGGVKRKTVAISVPGKVSGNHAPKL